ncbi:glycosyltransferase [Amycolatopsis pithecellobii]|uniref:Glycosyltransferase n=1 Tax=Amycolatopsis pithecellobii TaxID=664692 RepID=A0A6N7Z124_9PSEU|nr:glycosyltransferase [Amycolatopsis pithecellobii]MTD58032.1 glycosyltransferase [Amycolatopsis pithecellobii]
MTVTVVHIMGTLNRGGAESVALELCRHIPATEVRQRFLVLGGHEGSLAPRFRAAGATVDSCPVRPMVTFVPRLWSWLRAAHPDIVLSHVSLSSGMMLAVAALAGVPARIARLHSEGDGRPGTVIRVVQRAVMRMALRHCATAVLGVTDAALAFSAPPRGDRRYRVLPNGVDTGRFAVPAEPPAHPIFVHIGRCAPEKNRAFLLPVHTEACRLRPDTELVVAGPGGCTDLGSMAADSPLIRLNGEIEHVEKVLAEGSVLLLPSLREGLPGVVLEALATGVPVLASDLPGLRALSRQLGGITLLSLAAGPQVWARTALGLAEMPAAERQRIGAGLRRSPFALDRNTESWRQLWTTR